MRRTILIAWIMMIVMAVPLATIAADNFPRIPAQTSAQELGPHPSEAQQRLYYGYVPPPPILHTWPGGYRVLVHEISNTFMDHIVGRY